MNQYILRISAGVAALILGIGLASGLDRYRAFSLCEIEAHATTYNIQTVRVRIFLDAHELPRELGTIRIFDDPALGDQNVGFCRCNAGQLATASIRFEDDVRNAGISPNLGTENIRMSNDMYRLYDVVIVGQTSFSEAPGSQTTRMNIYNARVERVVSVQEFSSRRQALNSLKQNSH